MKIANTFNLLLALIGISYPFLVYFGLNRYGTVWIALILLIFSAIKWYLSSDKVFKWIFLLAFLLSVLSLLKQQNIWLQCYPVIMNFGFCGVFLYSIIHPPTIIESFARAKNPHLDDDAILWITRVTKVWCLFFILNGSIALWTVLYGSLKVWTIYNGFIAYILMAILFMTEWLWRNLKIRKNKSNA